MPLKVTVLLPCAAPKPPLLLMVTNVPTTPDVGETLMFGTTLNVMALLATPPTVTITLPVSAPLGTGTAICKFPQFVGEAVTPLNVTVLPLTCVAPKFVPLMVTEAPTAPEVGERLVMAGMRPKDTPLLA